MRLDEIPCDGQSQAGSGRRRPLVEPVEDARQHVGRNARSRVADADRNRIAPRLYIDRHDRPVRAVPQRIRQQVRQDLADPQRIEIHER